MIWIAGTALAFVFVKLGNLLLLVKMLTVGLGIAILTNVVLAAALIWRNVLNARIFGRQSRIRER